MLDAHAAAEELERCVAEHGFVGMVTAQHVLDRNLDDPAFDVVWSVAERLGVPVCVHGGGQAPGQVPVAIDRFSTRLAKHAITHPVGAMLALTSFTVGGVLARFPALRVAFLEAGAGWLPFWLERLDEHWTLMPEQAPELDRPPSEYFLGRGFVSCEPDERALPWVVDTLGDGVVCYASDYCHWDCSFPDSVKLLADRARPRRADQGRPPRRQRRPPLWAPRPRIGQTGVMTITEANPTAVHVGADELPFVDIGDGNKLKVLQVKEREGLWIIENIFQPGFEVQTHRHTGPVWGYTSSGAWKYKEYDYVNRAGSFLYEPAGSVHTLTCVEADTRVWFHMYGANLNLDADGNVESVTDGAGTLAAYYALCEVEGLPRPNVLTD